MSRLRPLRVPARVPRAAAARLRDAACPRVQVLCPIAWSRPAAVRHGRGVRLWGVVAACCCRARSCAARPDPCRPCVSVFVIGRCGLCVSNSLQGCLPARRGLKPPRSAHLDVFGPPLSARVGLSVRSRLLARQSPARSAACQPSGVPIRAPAMGQARAFQSVSARPYSGHHQHPTGRNLRPNHGRPPCGGLTAPIPPPPCPIGPSSALGPDVGAPPAPAPLVLGYGYISASSSRILPSLLPPTLPETALLRQDQFAQRGKQVPTNLISSHCSSVKSLG